MKNDLVSCPHPQPPPQKYSFLSTGGAEIFRVFAFQSWKNLPENWNFFPVFLLPKSVEEENSHFHQEGANSVLNTLLLLLLLLTGSFF